MARQRARPARNLDRRPAPDHRAIGEAPMSLIVTSPLRGWASAIDSVPDPVFAQRMMGDGVAIQPPADTIVAPFDGRSEARRVGKECVSPGRSRWSPSP